MIKQNEDTQEIDFILNIIDKEDWVDEEILLIYEDCYRRLKTLAEYFELDTKELDESRYCLMKKYGQI
jgi:hypothetical protein